MLPGSPSSTQLARPMSPGMMTGWPRRDRRRQFGMTGGKRPRGPLAMHAELLRLPSTWWFSSLAMLWATSYTRFHLQRFPRAAEELGEDLAGLPHQQLPVAQAKLAAAASWPDISVLPDCGRGAGQLPVGQLDAILGRRAAEHPQGVVAHLIAQAARAGMDHHANGLLGQAHGAGGRLVVDFLDHLHFEEMVARASVPH